VGHEAPTVAVSTTAPGACRRSRGPRAGRAGVARRVRRQAGAQRGGPALDHAAQESVEQGVAQGLRAAGRRAVRGSAWGRRPRPPGSGRSAGGTARAAVAAVARAGHRAVAREPQEVVAGGVGAEVERRGQFGDGRGPWRFRWWRTRSRVCMVPTIVPWTWWERAYAERPWRYHGPQREQRRSHHPRAGGRRLLIAWVAGWVTGTLAIVLGVVARSCCSRRRPSASARCTGCSASRPARSPRSADARSTPVEPVGASGAPRAPRRGAGRRGWRLYHRGSRP
jgi:hypothetical protein